MADAEVYRTPKRPPRSQGLGVSACLSSDGEPFYKIHTARRGETEPAYVGVTTLYLNDSDARQVSEKLVRALDAHLPAAGRSISDLIWDELDAVVDRLSGAGLKEEDSYHLRGRALGLAEALAIIANPYEPDVDEIRAESVRRARERR